MQSRFSFFYYQPALAKLIGRSPATFINALSFHLQNSPPDKQYEGKNWIGKTLKQWSEELRYSRRQIERIIYTLQHQKLLLIKQFNIREGNKTNFYTVNEEVLERLLTPQEKDNFSTNFPSFNFSTEETL